MQSTRSKQKLIDKENIGAAINFKNPQPGSRRLLFKEIRNTDQQTKFNGKIQIEVPTKISQPSNSDPKPVKTNTQLAEPYQHSILEYLKSRQYFYIVDKDYMGKQKDLNNRMRSILIDWLVDVSFKFKLLPQTLFMTVNLLDRYLSLRQIQRSELQLLGISALMIQAKFEEIYPPVLKDYIAVCDNSYMCEEILRMEETILSALHFNITQPSAFYFLQLIQQKLKLQPKQFIFAQYILESTLLDIECLRFNHINLVAGAVFLVNKIFNRGNWNHKYTLIFSVCEQEAKKCAKMLHSIMQAVDGTVLTAVKRKFSLPEFFEVSKYKIEKVNGSRDK